MLPLNEVVFNTEAHAFPRFQLGKLFKTGWERQQQAADSTSKAADTDTTSGSTAHAGAPVAREREPAVAAEGMKTVVVESAEQAGGS